eukprot:280945-Pelagomonas_calceolata.AAC.2
MPFNLQYSHILAAKRGVAASKAVVDHPAVKRLRGSACIVFGEAPVMRLKPLGLPASGKVHIWPALHTFHPLPSQTKLLGSPAVSGWRGRQWLELQKSLGNLCRQFVAWISQPSIRPGTWHACQAKFVSGAVKFQ